MSHEINHCNSKAFSLFEGRAKRREVWLFWLFMTVFDFLGSYVYDSSSGGIGFVVLFFMLFFFIPYVLFYVPLAVKRLHDMNWSGWLAILLFIPFISQIMLLILLFCCGTKGLNKYGSDIVSFNKIFKNLLKWVGMALFAFVLVAVVSNNQEVSGTRLAIEIDYNKLRAMLMNEYSNLDDDDYNEKMDKLLCHSKDKIIEVIRRRLDALGMKDSLVQSVNDGMIMPRFIVELPGVDSVSAKTVRECINKMSSVEFRFIAFNENELLGLLTSDEAPEGYVNVTNGYVRSENYQAVSSSANHLMNVAAFGVPHIDRRNTKFIFQRDGTAYYNGGVVTKYQGRFVEKGKPRLTGDALKSARVETRFDGSYAISFKLKDEESTFFAKLTRNNIGRQLAIILDGELISAPSITSAIEYGRGEINGDFTKEEANSLAIALTAGSLPAPLVVVEEVECLRKRSKWKLFSF